MARKCLRCNSLRLADVGASCGDTFFWSSDKIDHSGQFATPGGELGAYGLGIQFTYCLECGQIQGKFPVPGEFEE